MYPRQSGKTTLDRASFPDKPYISLENPDEREFAEHEPVAGRPDWAALGADCGISAVTAREWLSVLEASYLVTRLPPYFQNFGNRLVKSPKLYFLDVGLMA